MGSDIAASTEARRLFFFGFEKVGGSGGDEDEKTEVALTWSATFCFFFFFADDGGEVILKEGDDNDATAFLTFSTSWRSEVREDVGLTFCPLVVLGSAAAERKVGEVGTSCVAPGVLELAAALQYGRWLLSLLYVFPQCGHTSAKIKNIYKNYANNICYST